MTEDRARAALRAFAAVGASLYFLAFFAAIHAALDKLSY